MPSSYYIFQKEKKMKVCIEITTTNSDLYTKADELKVEYKDRKIIPDLYKTYKKTIILDTKATELNWVEIKNYKILTESNLILVLYDLTNIKYARENEIDWYSPVPVESYYQLNGFVNMHPRYIVLGAGLFFDIQNVVKHLRGTGVQIRHAPNIAYEDGLPHSDLGVTGTWILPQHLKYYKPYISTIEFHNCDQKTMYEIYIEQKEWRTRIDVLISNLTSASLGRLLPDEFAKTRLHCLQRCQHGGPCNICPRVLHLAASGDVIEQLLAPAT